MTPPFPPPGPPPFPPPGPPPGDGRPRDPRGNLPRIRNAIIGIIGLFTVGALLATCAIDGGTGSRSARDYIASTYQRSAALDEGGVAGYVANGDVTSVSRDISKAERPTDSRTGANTVGNVDGSYFLQYPDYLVGLFPYGANQTRVMISKDYRSGYNHYHPYVGGYWVPTPHYSGRGSGYRGGGSGAGK